MFYCPCAKACFQAQWELKKHAVEWQRACVLDFHLEFRFLKSSYFAWTNKPQNEIQHHNSFSHYRIWMRF